MKTEAATAAGLLIIEHAFQVANNPDQNDITPTSKLALGMPFLLEIANEDVEAIAIAEKALGQPPERIREVAIQYLKNAYLEHTENPYRVLGITPWSSFDDAKDRYRQLIRLFHPDRGTLVSKSDFDYAANINSAFTSVSEKFKAHEKQTATQKREQPSEPQQQNDSDRTPEISRQPVSRLFIDSWLLRIPKYRKGFQEKCQPLLTCIVKQSKNVTRLSASAIFRVLKNLVLIFSSIFTLLGKTAHSILLWLARQIISSLKSVLLKLAKVINSLISALTGGIHFFLSLVQVLLSFATKNFKVFHRIFFSQAVTLKDFTCKGCQRGLSALSTFNKSFYSKKFITRKSLFASFTIVCVAPIAFVLINQERSWLHNQLSHVDQFISQNVLSVDISLSQAPDVSSQKQIPAAISSRDSEHQMVIERELDLIAAMKREAERIAAEKRELERIAAEKREAERQLAMKREASSASNNKSPDNREIKSVNRSSQTTGSLTGRVFIDISEVDETIKTDKKLETVIDEP